MACPFWERELHLGIVLCGPCRLSSLVFNTRANYWDWHTLYTFPNALCIIPRLFWLGGQIMAPVTILLLSFLLLAALVSAADLYKILDR